MKGKMRKKPQLFLMAKKTGVFDRIHHGVEINLEAGCSKKETPMKPKTVRRVKSEQDSQTRAYPMHAGIVAGSIIFTVEGKIPVEYL